MNTPWPKKQRGGNLEKTDGLVGHTDARKRRSQRDCWRSEFRNGPNEATLAHIISGTGQSPATESPLSRPRPRRLSAVIRLDQAENLIQATGYAIQIGYPLNVFVTLLVERWGPPGRVHDTLQAWIEKASKWLSYRGLAMVPHIGVLENSFQFGIHAHILMHVPAPMRRAFKQRGRRWLGKDAPAQSITVRGTRYPGLGDDPLRPMKGRLRYILKCIETEAGKLLDIVPKGRDHIVGKRVWVAQCIGPAARAGRLQKRARKIVRTLAGPGGSEGLESVRSTLSSSSTDER